MRQSLSHGRISFQGKCREILNQDPRLVRNKPMYAVKRVYFAVPAELTLGFDSTIIVWTVFTVILEEYHEIKYGC